MQTKNNQNQGQGDSSDSSDLRVNPLYKNGKSITMQDIEVRDDLEKLHVVLLDEDGGK